MSDNLKIEELILSHFGKFHNCRISLQDGINIIYGENEKGKSTIHKFIEGVFFGFFLPYRKNKQYSADHTRYKPWEGVLYSGSLIYEADGRKYRITRNFQKGRETVKLFDEATSEELSDSLRYNANIRLHEPFAMHLGINQTVYRNTVSVCQLGNITEPDLAGEVKQSLINYGGSRDENISVVEVLGSLAGKAEKIGSEKTRVKPLGIAAADVERLEDELDESKKKYNELFEIGLNIKKLNDEISAINEQIRENDELAARHERIDMKRRFIRASEINREISELENEIKHLEKYKSINKENLARIVLLDNLMKSREEQKSKLSFKISQQAMDSGQIKGKAGTDGGLHVNFGMHANSSLHANSGLHANDGLNKAKTGRIKWMAILSIISILGVLVIFAGVVINPLIFAGLVFLIPLYVMAVKSLDRSNTADRSADDELLAGRLTALYERDIKEFEDIAAEINNLKCEYMKLLHENSVNSLAEYEFACKCKNEYNDRISRLANLKNSLGNVLDKYAYEELKEIVSPFLQEELPPIEKPDSGNIKNESVSLGKRLIEIHNTLGKLEESASSIERNYREVSVIEADIREKGEIRATLANRRDALLLAASVIEKASGKIQREFAPKLNKNVAVMINRITEGKYSDIKIDPNLDIKVIDLHTGNVTGIHELSTGTIDQLYLSVRLGVINTIKEDRILPLILDDCFVNYDNTRLSNALDYISRESEQSGRQVIVFTCQKREKEALDMLGKKYNLFCL